MIGARLHQSLPLDDTAALTLVRRGCKVWLEDRRHRLLELENQRIALVPPEHQDHPAAGSNAADADDLPGDVHKPVPLDHRAGVRL
jgi:hypothetical protein